MGKTSTTILAVLCLPLFAACGGGGSGQGASPPTPPANRAPTVADAAVAVDPGNALNGTLSGSDPDNDPLTFSVTTTPVSGNVTLSGTGNANFQYVPNAGFVGSDSFAFTANDGALSSVVGTISVTVNTKPIALAADFETNADAVIDATLAGNDAEGDALTFALVTQPALGRVSSFDPTSGQFRYSPDAGQDGPDSFTVTATDGFQTSDPATINVTIYRWAGTQQYGSDRNDSAGNTGMVRDSSGNIIVSGGTSGTINGDANLGLSDSFVRKFDRRGNEMWTRQFGDAADNFARAVLAIPSSEDLFVLERRFEFPQSIELLVRRIDRDGIELWNASVDYAGLDLKGPATGASVDSNGDIYIVSEYDDDPTQSVGRTAAVINKVSGADGSPIWQRLLAGRPPMGVPPFISAGSTIHARGAAVNQDNDLIVVGRSSNVGSGTACTYCGFLVAFDSDGNQLWLRSELSPSDTCQDGENAELFGVAVADDNGLFITGTNSPGSSFFFEDGLLFKMNSDATQEEWAYCDDTGDDVRSVYSAAPIAARNGGVIAVSEFRRRDNVDFVSIIKLDDGGQLERVLRFTADDLQGVPADFLATGLVEDEQEYVYIHGTTEGALAPTAPLGGNDVFLLRLDPLFSLP